MLSQLARSSRVRCTYSPVFEGVCLQWRKDSCNFSIWARNKISHQSRPRWIERRLVQEKKNVDASEGIPTEITIKLDRQKTREVTHRFLNFFLHDIKRILSRRRHVSTVGRNGGRESEPRSPSVPLPWLCLRKSPPSPPEPRSPPKDAIRDLQIPP